MIPVKTRTERNREWREKNPERHRELGRQNQYDAYTRLKLEFITAYGGACTCCGEKNIHFLTIEHVGGIIPDTHRMSGGKRLSGLALLRKIKSEGYPDSVTVFCMNCNYANGHYGFCPHVDPYSDMRRY